MALKGELLSADLSNVFQMLAMNGKRGMLTVQDRVNPVARRRFFLDGQTVLPADPIAQRPSVALLVEMGYVTYEQYASVMTRARRFNSDPWSILKAQGTLADDAVDAFRARASNESLLEVFLWRDIRFTLDETTADPPETDAPPIQIDAVIMEAARRQDEWIHVVEAVGSHRDVFRQCADAQADLGSLGDVERIVYDQINGLDGAPDIVAKCELPHYHVETSLASLLRQNLIAKVSPEELIISGDKLLAAGQTREGIRLFHCALRSDRANFAIHKRLADAHMKVGQFARACGHLRYCSVLALTEGRAREAITLLQTAWKLLPTQFSTLERILSILIDDPRVLTRDDRACLADSRKLLQVWHDTGETERAVELATRIWEIDQSDREVLHTAARLNLRLGRVEAAVTGYLALADRYRADRNLRGALDIYRTIASLGGVYAKAYDAQINEIKGELGRVATRKRRGQSARVAMVSLAVLGVIYVAYAWFADQAVRDIEERVAADPRQRDALIPDLRKAAFWFRPTPAGARAANRAAEMTAEAEAEREAVRRKNEIAAAKLASQHKAADEAVSEGLRMVKAGDLLGAAELIRSGLESFPSPDSPAATRAAKALADVERYLEQGRVLLEEARAIEATDPDAAFRLRLKALRDYDLLPEMGALRLTLRIESVPPDAKLSVLGAAEDYTAPIGIEVGGQGLLLVEARAPGYLPRSFAMSLPPEVATWTLVLERRARATLATKTPTCSVTPWQDGQVLVAARNGPLFLVDAAAGRILSRYKPEGICSQSMPPTISGWRALCVYDDGRMRVMDLNTLKEVRTFRLAMKTNLRPAPCSAGWVVPVAPDRLQVLDQHGVTLRRYVLPGGSTLRDFAVVDGRIWCAAGATGLLAFDLANEDPAREVSPKFTTSLCAGPGRSLLVHRPQVGIVRVDIDSGEERVLFTHSADRACVHRIRDDRWFALFDGEIVFLSEAGPAGHARVAGVEHDHPVIVDGALGNAGVTTDGWCSMFDFTTASCMGGFAVPAGSSPACAAKSFVNVHADGRVTITDL